ncbi:MAG: dihydrofolate reductase family protein [Anaerolineae bacterium]|nr:dihydrofolate reductase family protein [Anaerolineae bacterium]
MRNVILLINISLDGYINGPHGEMDWIGSEDDIWADFIAVQNTADTALYGRVNYEGAEGYWKSGAVNQATSKGEIEHAGWLTQSTRLVFSRTLDRVEWPGTRIVSDHIAETMAELKRQPGKNMILFGGADIAGAFMKLGLIDEYRIYVNPVVLGGGKRLFEANPDKLNLKLLGTKAFASGAVALHYGAPA